MGVNNLYKELSEGKTALRPGVKLGSMTFE